jgi:type VI secretion system secreted protein Hcp
MAFDAFLKLDGIEGESTDAAHKGEIEVLSFSWGVNQTFSPGSGGAGGSGKASFQDLHFNTIVSKASPRLFKACATGEHIKKASLSMRKAGGRQQQEFLKIELEEVLVSSYQPAGDTGGDAPVEDLALSFAKIRFSYIPQNADGSAGDPVTAGFDIPANKGT